jgi:hypothetical protein
MRPIPYGKEITLTSHGRDVRLAASGGQISAKAAGTRFKVVDAGLGRVFLAANGQHLSVSPTGAVSMREARTTAESFQWIETPTGELVLMSLANHRFLRIDPMTGTVVVDSPGPQSDGKDGVRFDWAN